jgi:hypothetical protein
MGNVPISMSLQEGSWLVQHCSRRAITFCLLPLTNRLPTARITANAEWAGTLQSNDDVRQSDGALTHSLSDLNDSSRMGDGEVPSYE